MDGIRLMRLLDVLPVLAARNAVGVSPRSIIVKCDRLEAVDQVLFNGIASPAFAVYSAHELVAQVPEALEDAIITDVAVLSSVPTLTQRSLVELGIGTRVLKQVGVQRLLQTFVRLLLRTPGSNLFHKALGGGVTGSVGNNVSSRLAADVAIAISNVKTQIIAAQSPYSSIPPAERLLSAEVASLVEDPANTSVYCTVVVTAHDRQRSAATFVS